MIYILFSVICLYAVVGIAAGLYVRRNIGYGVVRSVMIGILWLPALVGYIIAVAFFGM